MHETAVVMIVDDDPDNLKLLARILQKKSYRVLQAPDSPTALQAAAKDPPDLILLDIIMPGLDGFEVCRHFKTDVKLREIPIIFISVLDDTANKVKAFSQGGVDYISKPIQGDEVLARVGTHLEILSLQRQLRAQNENLEQMVVRRTRELAMANLRLKKLDHLKGDFLRMISHEIRTPVNGVLGIGELIIDLTPSTENSREYTEMFRESSKRLRNLIEDASMIGDMEYRVTKMDEPLVFAVLLDELKQIFPDVRITIEQDVAPEAVYCNGEKVLLTKALETVISLAACFSSDAHTIDLQGSLGEEHFNMRIELDALVITRKEAEVFFNMETTFRSLTPAEDLGLAPITAHRILTAFGGGLSLVKKEGHTGYLEVIIPVVSNPFIT